MTSEDSTTGSVGATDAERRWAAGRSRWWNSTGNGTINNAAGKGNVKAGDGGMKFRQEWPELHAQNMAWMKENDIDLVTGNPKNQPAVSACGPTAALRRPSGSAGPIGAVVEGGQVARDAGQSWLRQNKLIIAGALIFTYVLVARILSDGT